MTSKERTGHPLFGALEYDCKKYPLWRALYRANGGFWGIVAVFGIFGPMLGMYFSLALYWVVHQSSLPNRDLTLLRPFYFPSAMVLILFFTFIFWRNYLFAKRVSMTLYSKGLVLGTAKGPISCPYHKISAVYFGSKNQGMNLLMKIPSGAMSMAKSQLKSRITFEIQGSPAVAYVQLDRYFTTESIVLFLAKLEQHTNKAAGVTKEFLV
jgi:hypothetical protein